MQITQTNSDGLKRDFTIVVDAAEIDTKVTERLTTVGADIKLPGFRPGKVPLAILRQRFGKSVMGEVLEQTVNDHPLIYMDNAATTQKPRAVIQSLLDYYQLYNSNVHRSGHSLGEQATHEYEKVRD